MSILSALLAPGTRPLWIAGVGGFLLSAAVLAPASLVAAIAKTRAPLLEIGSSKGTFWRGAFYDVAYNGILLGDISLDIKPLSLLAGSLVIDAASRGGALSAKGRAYLSPSTVEFRDVTALFNLEAVRQYTFFGARYQGSARIEAKSLRIRRASCDATDARIATDALDTLSRKWSGASFPLAGDIECADSQLHLKMKGRNDSASAQMIVSVKPDLSYTIILTAEPARAEIDDALRIFGFEGDGEQLSWRAVGKLKGLKS